MNDNATVLFWQRLEPGEHISTRGGFLARRTTRDGGLGNLSYPWQLFLHGKYLGSFRALQHAKDAAGQWEKNGEGAA